MYEGSDRETIERAKQKRVDDVDKFLTDRFGRRMVSDVKEIHMLEEQRPIETLWDVTTAVTAHARTAMTIRYHRLTGSLSRAGT